MLELKIMWDSFLFECTRLERLVICVVELGIPGRRQWSGKYWWELVKGLELIGFGQGVLLYHEA